MHVPFQENRCTDAPTRIRCVLHTFQRNSQIAPHTDSLCSVCYFSGKSGHRFPPHGFAVLFMIFNETHRLRPTQSFHRCPHTDSLCSACSFSGKVSHSWTPHGFDVLSMIIKEIHRQRPTWIFCALYNACSLSGKSVHRCPHTDSLCSSCFSTKFTDSAPHGFAVLCLLFFRKIRPQIPPTRIRCALHDFQRNSQIAPHTNLMCSSCFSGIITDSAEHGFTVLFMISKGIHRLCTTRIRCPLHDFRGNSQIAPHSDSLCFACSFSGVWDRRCSHTDSLCSSCYFTELTDCAPHGFDVLFMFFRDNHR